MSKLVYKYSDDAREIIRAVFKFCKEEKESGLKISLARVWERTAALTGISRSTAQTIVDEKQPEQEPQTQTVPKRFFDDFDKGVVRRTISDMYAKKKRLPTLANIQVELKESIGYEGSREFLRQQLLKMKFSYARCEVNRRVLMERQDVILSRIQYLRRIRDLRKTGHTIIYTDETYVQTNHTVPKCWQDATLGMKIPFSKGERMIILHAGYEGGFIPNADLVFKAHTTSGDYHQEMNHQNFVKWLREKLIPNIPAKSVLVLDNAAYHNVQVDRCPTTGTRKSDIQEWLKRQGIPFAQTLLKPELLELCRKHKQSPVFVVDEILAAHGHQAIRLPPYHAELNPIELIWGIFKGYIARNNMTFSIKRTRELIVESLSSITSGQWSKCIAHVIEKENEYWASDIACDAMQEPIIIYVDDSDDSETDTASETEEDCMFS